LSEGYDMNDLPPLVQGEIWRAKVKEHSTLDADKAEDKDRLVIVESFTERFGCSSGFAFKVMGCCQLISPKFVSPYEKIKPAEFGLLVHEIHKQGCEITSKYTDKILSLLNKGEVGH